MRIDQVFGYGVAHFLLGREDLLDPHFLQNLDLGLPVGAHDDAPHADLLQDKGGQKHSLEVFPDGNHHGVHVADALGEQGVLVGRIQGYGVGYPVADLLHLFLVGVDGDDFRSFLGQTLRDGRTEASHSDDGKSSL